MIADYGCRLQAVRKWAESARSAGWLNEDDLGQLDRLETGAAQDLFNDAARRPLIVGLFGGTGVGKSSLLNRLAGEPIAEVGVKRPTSMRATIYLHRSQAIAALPQDSPIAATDMRYHEIDSRRDVAWLDMPDIDSVEAANRQLVMAWLPYVDWLIYVVSPERYRDDAGWQVLQQRHHRHHWLFVINRWDEAKQMQLDEFAADLRQAGFDAPRVLRTSCAGDRGYDIDQLQQVIDDAIDRHGLAELQRIGMLARLQDLKSVEDRYRHRFGDRGGWARLQHAVLGSIDRRLEVFGARLQPGLASVARRYPPAPAWWRGEAAGADLPEVDVEKSVWSDYCDGLLDNIATDAVIAADAEGIAEGPISRVLREQLSPARGIVLEALRAGLGDSIASPGTTVSRMARAVVGFAAYAMPVGVALWVLYNVVATYRLGLSGQADFLGLDFAVHSLLLLGLAWFVPFLVGRWLRPSLRDAARRGLRRGLDAAIGTLRRRLIDACESLERERTRLLEHFPQ